MNRQTLRGLTFVMGALSLFMATANAKAESMLSKNRSIESIRKELTKVNTSLRTSIENTKLARVTFADELKARS